MGAIWNAARREHNIIVNGKSIGKINAATNIIASPLSSANLETSLNALYKYESKKINRKVDFHIYDKLTGEYAMCIHDSSVKLDDKWWEPSKE